MSDRDLWVSSLSVGGRFDGQQVQQRLTPERELRDSVQKLELLCGNGGTEGRWGVKAGTQHLTFCLMNSSKVRENLEIKSPESWPGMAVI